MALLTGAPWLEKYHHLALYTYLVGTTLYVHTTVDACNTVSQGLQANELVLLIVLVGTWCIMGQI